MKLGYHFMLFLLYMQSFTQLLNEPNCLASSATMCQGSYSKVSNKITDNEVRCVIVAVISLLKYHHVFPYIKIQANPYQRTSLDLGDY